MNECMDASLEVHSMSNSRPEGGDSGCGGGSVLKAELGEVFSWPSASPSVLYFWRWNSMRMRSAAGVRMSSIQLLGGTSTGRLAGNAATHIM